MTRAYFRDAVGALLIFDVTNPSSFDSLKGHWLKQLKDFGHAKMSYVLVGNKLDKLTPGSPRVPIEDAVAFATENNMDYIDVSAQSGLNVETAFRRCILSVAKLLPDVSSFLELNGLPTGWIKLSKPLISISAPNMLSGQQQSSGDKDKIVANSSSSSSSSDRPQAANSAAISRQGTLSSTLSIRGPNLAREYVYVNYWTGEEMTLAEPPIQGAPTNLIYESNRGVMTSLELSFRDSRTSDVAPGQYDYASENSKRTSSTIQQATISNSSGGSSNSSSNSNSNKSNGNISKQNNSDANTEKSKPDTILSLRSNKVNTSNGSNEELDTSSKNKCCTIM
jgi:hypothetical protein